MTYIKGNLCIVAAMLCDAVARLSSDSKKESGLPIGILTKSLSDVIASLPQRAVANQDVKELKRRKSP